MGWCPALLCGDLICMLSRKKAVPNLWKLRDASRPHFRLIPSTELDPHIQMNCGLKTAVMPARWSTDWFQSVNIMSGKVCTQCHSTSAPGVLPSLLLRPLCSCPGPLAGPAI